MKNFRDQRDKFIKDLLTQKRSAREWAAQYNMSIIDPRGWKKNDGVTLDTPILLEEFERRAEESTYKVHFGGQKL